MAEILIVDDERAIREGLKMTLSSEGFAVRTARDGDDALKKIGEHKPDLVLLARINRALERSSAIGESGRSASGSVIALGSVSVDVKSFAVTENGEEIARLTKTEADILKLLDSKRGELVVQDDIITDLRGNGFACEDTMLYVHICHLRRKLGPASSMIINKRGVGYCLGA